MWHLVRPRFMVHRWPSSPCVLTWQEELGQELSGTFYKGTSPAPEGPTLVTSSPPKGLTYYHHTGG